jgi:hypothetical protein
MASWHMMEDGTPGAPSVAHILGCPSMSALAPKKNMKNPNNANARDLATWDPR